VQPGIAVQKIHEVLAVHPVRLNPRAAGKRVRRRAIPGQAGDVAGEIARIYVENGQPVEYGELLFAILPGKKK